LQRGILFVLCGWISQTTVVMEGEVNTIGWVERITEPSGNQLVDATSVIYKDSIYFFGGFSFSTKQPSNSLIVWDLSNTSSFTI
jgi:hypothetical protein